MAHVLRTRAGLRRQVAPVRRTVCGTATTAPRRVRSVYPQGRASVKSAGKRNPVLRVLTYVRVIALIVALVLILVPVIRHSSGPFAPGHIALIVFTVIVVLSSIALGIYRIKFDRRNAAESDQR